MLAIPLPPCQWKVCLSGMSKLRLAFVSSGVALVTSDQELASALKAAEHRDHEPGTEQPLVDGLFEL